MDTLLLVHFSISMWCIFYLVFTAIKLRKNPSRTYFIDKMQKKLNEKIRRDEELERMRR